MAEGVRTGEWYTFGQLGERVPDLGAATLKLRAPNEVRMSVCLSVRSLKAKRFELSTPISVEAYSQSIDSEVKRSMFRVRVRDG